MRRNTLFYTIMLALLLLFLLPIMGLAEEKEEPIPEEPNWAENLSRKCDYSQITHAACLRDDNKASNWTYPTGMELRVSWKEQIPAKYCFIAFKDRPVPFEICQMSEDGTEIRKEEGAPFLNYAYELLPETRSIVILNGEEKMTLSSLYIYGEGTIPDHHPWKQVPEKLDYLVIATHPDDDVLFLGAVVPNYGAGQGKEGTVVITATHSRLRMDEALNGAWELGLRNVPVFAGFEDLADRKAQAAFKLEALIQYYVRLFRQYQPEVVVTQDLAGEYGHWQHKRVSQAVVEAITMAADPGYDPESVETHGTWQVKKLYIHLYPDNQVQLNVQEPIEALDGKTALEAATAAFACHVSQNKSGHHAVRNEGVYDLSLFGLAFTTVGMDTPGVNDFFEHIS